MNTKLIDAGVSSKHAKNWTASEAIRELVQNWLDVKNQFKVTGSITWVGGMARIKDMGPGLQMKHLAFGENDKAEGSIGQFGEGMKSAFVSLIRMGRKVRIQTNGMVIVPTLQESEAFGIETLHYKISPMVPRVAARMKGTDIRVECSQIELKAAEAYFVALNNVIWLDEHKVSYPGGLIYINGSAVAKIPNAAFSYHFGGKAAEKALSRDRNAVDMDFVTSAIERTLDETGSTELMERIIEMYVNMSKGQPVNNFEARLSLYPEKSRIWKRVWNRMVGTKAVISNGMEYDTQAIYRGYRILGHLDYRVESFLHNMGVPGSKDVTHQKVKKSSPVALKNLTRTQRENFKWAKKMVKKYYVDPGNVQVVENIQAHSKDSSLVTLGLYVGAKDRILISKFVLEDRSTTLHVLLHESVHKTSKTADLTVEFERALMEVAVKIVENRESKTRKRS